MYIGLICLTVFFALYTGLRLIGPSGLGRGGRFTAWFCLVYAWASIPVEAAMLRAGIESRALDVLAFAGAIAFGIAALVLVVLVFRDVLLFAGKSLCFVRTLSQRLQRISPERAVADSCGITDTSRRHFLKSISGTGVMAVAGTFSGSALYGALRIPPLTDVSIKIAGLHPDLEGYTIVQLSDLHVGASLGVDWLNGVVDAANGAGADMIAVTGDMVDGSPAHLWSDIQPFARLTAPDGVYGVSGNHEFYSGIERWLPAFEAVGLTMLENRNVMVRRGGASLLVGGISDYEAVRFGRKYRSDSRKAMQGGESADFRLLLAHQPASVYKAHEAGWDAMLCGHTHGGQVFPFMAVVTMVQPYLSGLHDHDGMLVYVSRGTGFWGPPFRLGAPAEITRIKLQRV
ncbi:metallophosphoesterase [Oleidesulfovibrio sp.]|uniref:metallophosphoesterase n=1 Tax=Oleidesulfovibrio sp. TaxID=2909707 RepID=UPI003A8508B4